jgi:hypothetical protein
MEWMAVRLATKLKSLKSDLKGWHSQVFGRLDVNIDDLVDQLKHLDLKAESVALSTAESDARFQDFHNLWDLLRARESQIFQQSRMRWIREGDVNSGFFHASIKMRRRRNSILALRVGNRWVESVQEIRAEVVDFYKNQFSETKVDRPTLDGVPLTSLSHEEVGGLTVPFRDDEIRELVLASDGSKCP